MRATRAYYLFYSYDSKFYNKLQIYYVNMEAKLSKSS